MDSPETISPLDYPALVSRCAGDAEIANSLLRKFQLRIPAEIVQISETCRMHDMDAVAKAAHALKGAAAMMSADPLRARALALELAAKAGDTAEVQTCLQTLQQEFLLLTEYIDILLQRLSK